MKNKWVVRVLGLNEMGKPIQLARYGSSGDSPDSEHVIRLTAETYSLSVEDFTDLFNPNVVMEEFVEFDKLIQLPKAA